VNLVTRGDRVLLIGLAVAVMVVLARPMRYVLDAAHDVEQVTGLALVPGLIILSLVFIFHQQAKRAEALAEAASLEEEALQAQARTAELERLVFFGQALGRSLDIETIREVVIQHLPKLAGTEDLWVMMRADGHWHTIMGAAQDGRRDLAAAREQIADRSMSDVSSPVTEAVRVDGHMCMPLTAGGHAVGVMAIPQTATVFDEARTRVLAAAAAILGISLRNSQLFREVRENSLRDGLTGCFNRTYGVELIATELRRARRSQLPLSLIIFDLDHFKRINDRHGHLCGDSVLATVGARMRENLRGSDVKCRYGGEEFLVLLPDTPLEGAKRVAEALRRELAEIIVTWRGEAVTFTASFGVTAAQVSEVDAQALISRADGALYRAKADGRNCVRLAAAVPVREPTAV
jgi:diguanylate cyclase (GGDEF)-like protein